MRDVRTGLYGVLIMHALSESGPLHGYGLRQYLIKVSGGILNPSESTVYETLKKLEKEGLIKSSWSVEGGGLPRKYYRLTEDGLSLLREVRGEVLTLLKAVIKALGD